MRDLKRSGGGPDAPSKWLRAKVIALLGLYLLLLTVVLGRAVQLQIFDRDTLGGMARDQYVRQVEVPARRGDIFDRRGVALAQSVEVDSLYADPSLIPDVPAAAKKLARALKLDASELEARMVKGRRFAWVKRQVKPQELAAVDALGIPGLGTIKEPRRFYPQRELAAHVLGTVGTDGHGLEGLERAFEDELSGQVSRMQGFRDAKGRKVQTGGMSDPLEQLGASVTLTIDRQLQHVAEKALTRAVTDSKATAGMAVVLEPTTGELLALANWPTFNPNTPRDSKRDAVRNRSVLDVFEPGSTLKAFVVAAALDAKVLKENETLDCEKGRMPIGRHVINDTHPHELLTPREILQVSSNICSAKIGQRLGRERLQQTYFSFGFGERPGLALPGEGKGSVPFPKAEITLATQSFGQGLSASAVQIAAAYGALANNGTLMRPYLVSKVVDPDGLVLLENQPTPLRQVVAPGVARSVVEMLESVTQKEGTAPRAALEGYRVAGKTGTAQKVDPVARGYSDKRIASFVGMVPAERPRAVILVVIDEPSTNVYGGVVAAPAFKEIASATMAYLGVAPSRPQPLVTVASPAGKKGQARVAEREIAAVTETPVEPASAVDEAGGVRVPDLSGQVGRVAITRLLGARLQPEVVGSGRVVGQVPAAGSLVERGARVRLTLAGR